MSVEFAAAGGLAVKLLRLTPLVTTTVLLVNRLAQYYALSTFLPPHTDSKKIDHVGAAVKNWLQAVVPRIWTRVIGIVLVTRIALILNLFVRPDDLAGTHARHLYGVGLFFSFAHLLAGPTMIRYEKQMMNPETIPEVMLELLKGWLSVNGVRIWVVDVPFWVVGLLATLEAWKI